MILKNLTSSDILSIPLSNPEKLFSYDNMKGEYKNLASLWHPDKSSHPESNKVFAHISTLYEAAQIHRDASTWKGPAEIIFTSKDSRTFKFKYKKATEFELGKMYIGLNNVVYVIKPEFEDLYKNGLAMINRIQYRDSRQEEQFKRQVPELVTSFESDNGFVAVFKKTPDLVLLKDLLDFYSDRKLPMVHVAWIISTLSNLLCFIQTNNMVHGAISIDTFFVSPEYHSGTLIGGWWYARPRNQKLLALPNSTLAILPKKMLVDKLAKLEYDVKLIKSLGIETLGDPTKTGSMLLSDKTIPSVILTWLRNSTTSKSAALPAIIEYSNWEKVRDDGLGKRTFIKLDVDISKIY